MYNLFAINLLSLIMHCWHTQ